MREFDSFGSELMEESFFGGTDVSSSGGRTMSQSSSMSM